MPPHSSISKPGEKRSKRLKHGAPSQWTKKRVTGTTSIDSSVPILMTRTNGVQRVCWSILIAAGPGWVGTQCAPTTWTTIGPAGVVGAPSGTGIGHDGFQPQGGALAAPTIPPSACLPWL